MWYINSEIFKTTQGGKKMSEVKDSVAETPSQNYTKEQILFCAWLNSMKKLEMIPAEERTFKQNQEISDLKMKMWQTIVKYARIQRCTTPEEAELLARRINPDGKKEKPYDLVAKQSGKSIKRVKSQLNQAVCKLNQDDTLRKRFGKINRYSDLRPLELQDNSSALLEQQLETFLSEISSVTEDL